jgi:hypothetical protein
LASAGLAPASPAASATANAHRGINVFDMVVAPPRDVVGTSMASPPADIVLIPVAKPCAFFGNL